MKEEISLLTFLFETLKIIVMYYYIIGLTPAKRKTKFLIIPVWIILGTAVCIEKDFDFFCSIVLALSIAFLCYKEQLKLKILTIIMSWYTVSFIDLMMWLICMTVFPINGMSLVDIVSNVTGILPLIAAGMIMKKKNITLREKLKETHIVKYLLVILVIIAMCIVTACMQGIMLGQITDATRRLVVISSVILSFFVVALCVLYINVESSRKQLIEINALNERCIEYQKKYYFDVMKKDEELRAFKHDVKKHMTAIEILFEKKQYDEMKNYLNNIRDYLETDIIYKTGNEIVNYILNATIREIESEGPLEIHVIGKFQRDCKLSNTDICILFANILDNAKEAVLQYFGHRMLTVELRNYRDRMYISIKNSSPERDYKLGKSTKKDKENHGYGMKNVYDVIKKYNGSIDMKWENDTFITNIEI